MPRAMAVVGEEVDFSVRGDRVTMGVVEVEVPPRQEGIPVVLAAEPAGVRKEEMAATIFPLEVLVKRLEEVVEVESTLKGETAAILAAAVGEGDMRRVGMADSAVVAVGLRTSA